MCYHTACQRFWKQRYKKRRMNHWPGDSAICYSHPHELLIYEHTVLSYIICRQDALYKMYKISVHQRRSVIDHFQAYKECLDVLSMKRLAWNLFIIVIGRQHLSFSHSSVTEKRKSTEHMEVWMLQHTCGRQEGLGYGRGDGGDWGGGKERRWTLYPQQSLDKTSAEVRNHRPVWSILPVFPEYGMVLFLETRSMGGNSESTAGANLPFNIHNGLSVHCPLQMQLMWIISLVRDNYALHWQSNTICQDKCAGRQRGQSKNKSLNVILKYHFAGAKKKQKQNRAESQKLLNFFFFFTLNIYHSLVTTLMEHH